MGCREVGIGHTENSKRGTACQIVYSDRHAAINGHHEGSAHCQSVDVWSAG